MEAFRLTGKTAIVTGAGAGLGNSMAAGLAEAGARVALIDIRPDIGEIAKRMCGDGRELVGIQANLTDREDLKRGFGACLRLLGGVDILINNAGITKDGLLMKMSEDDFDAVVDTNLKGAFHCIRFVSRAMIRQRSGRIINISSVSGVLGNAGQANYAASKAGVIGLTKSAARELAGRKITVNAVAPGFIRTEMTAVLSEKVKEKAVLQIPMERFGEAEDVAQAVAFLASEQAGYITGQVLCVDGGMAM